jgi:hypothetical protein
MPKGTTETVRKGGQTVVNGQKAPPPKKKEAK